ncbi:PDZ domain-containing protein [Lactobacillus sp. CC-MHH1034]|uniref:PDZ domain-containing protein n=1 Tax=Agrilactobacillus fermenti TaxID=2586909 RepID=UPI001E4B46A9|nr:PDZ domain-containing protein [Agrilactobacillus fermenti]MCD2257216.1 PDZ domain-containing protein [Agrilactobacillus fermenti]
MLNAILFYFLNPVTIVGCLTILLISNLRINRERRQFSIAIDANLTETVQFLENSLLVGVFASIASLVLGIFMTAAWVNWYIIIALASILAFSLGFDSLILISVSTLLAQVFSAFGHDILPFFPIRNPVQGHSTASGLYLAALVSLILVWLLSRIEDLPVDPKIRVSKRGVREVFYRVRTLNVAPLLVTVPGTRFHDLFGFWPIFKLGDHMFTIMILPLVVGLSLQLRQRLPIELKRLRPIYVTSAIVFLVLALVDRLSQLDRIFAVAGVVFAILIWTYRCYFLRRGQSTLLEMPEGLRVVAIQKGTPAEKSGLEIGDVILEANDQAVRSEADLYAQIQAKPTFVKFRVKTQTGDIKLAETAIYKDSPHELGLFTFPDELFTTEGDKISHG